MSSDLLYMLFLILMQGEKKKKQPGLPLENSIVRSEKGVGGQCGELCNLHGSTRGFWVMGTWPLVLLVWAQCPADCPVPSAVWLEVWGSVLALFEVRSL